MVMLINYQVIVLNYHISKHSLSRNRLFQVCYMRDIIINCFTSWRETIVDICCDSDNVATVRREIFDRDAVASYFRWHMGILVLSTDVKLIVRTVGIASMCRHHCHCTRPQ